jgi:hypothetical protein
MHHFPLGDRSNDRAIRKHPKFCLVVFSFLKGTYFINIDSSCTYPTYELIKKFKKITHLSPSYSSVYHPQTTLQNSRHALRGRRPCSDGHADRVFRALALASLYILARRRGDRGALRLRGLALRAACLRNHPEVHAASAPRLVC